MQCKSKDNLTDVTKDVTELLKKDLNLGPTMVRLAWHSAGTYSALSKTNGSNGGTIRHKDELGHGANAGLTKLVSMLDVIYSKHKSKISFADLIVLAGCVAIHEMGGPKIIFRSGRKDKPVEETPPEGRLPDADKGSMKKTNSHLRDVFGKMGFEDKDIVVLSGAHALGRCHPNASGYDGPWTPAPLTFNNYYYSLLLNDTWMPTTVSKTGNKQFNNKDGLMMLPSDMALLEDDKFK